MNKIEDFIQLNSPDGGFLQSEYWRKFQESYGRKTFHLEERDKDNNTIILANMVVHTLPMVGNYFYLPRGPVIEGFELGIHSRCFPYRNERASNFKPNSNDKIRKFMNDLVELARKSNIGWIRVEPNSEEEVGLIRKNLPNGAEIRKSRVDVQPREILILDITKSKEELLVQMKQKTRYNIRLAEKRGVKIFVSREGKHMERFLELIRITAKRNRITPHPYEYYRKMLEVIPSDILKLYLAEYEGKVICANIVSFFGKTATYMHGASANEHRSVMAPYLLQWQQIQDAKVAGCERYDLGGVRVLHNLGQGAGSHSSWDGITRFKTGFAPRVGPIRFPGCWDIILRPFRYNLYKVIRKMKEIVQ